MTDDRYCYVRGWLTGVVRWKDEDTGDMQKVIQEIIRLSETTGSRSELQKLILGVLSEHSDMCNAHLATLASNLANGLKRLEDVHKGER